MCRLPRLLRISLRRKLFAACLEDHAADKEPQPPVSNTRDTGGLPRLRASLIAIGIKSACADFVSTAVRFILRIHLSSNRALAQN